MSLSPGKLEFREIHLALMRWWRLEAHQRIGDWSWSRASDECAQLAHTARVAGRLCFGEKPDRGQLGVLCEPRLNERLVGIQLALLLGSGRVSDVRDIDVTVGLSICDPSLDRAAADLESPGQHGHRYSLFQVVFQKHTSLRVDHN